MTTRRDETTPPTDAAPSDEKCVRVGVSRCLLGDRVRYDGGHKRDPFVLNFLAPYVDFVPVCPEVEVGMKVPRPTLRLVRDDRGPRMVIPDEDDRDVTDDMNRYSARRTRELERDALDGFILKSGSPSCGMERVKLYGKGGMPMKAGVGLFAAALMERMPLLPVEEEGRLNDPVLRENFIVRVFAHRRLADFFSGRWTLGGLVRLHTAEKLLLLSHEPVAYQELGRLVGNAKATPRAELRDRYVERHARALQKRATRGRHTNVLQHMAGYVRDHVDVSDRQELEGIIQDYRKGLVPLVVPITLIRHHARRHGVDYLLGQVYLSPHPKEWMLRNHV